MYVCNVYLVCPVTAAKPIRQLRNKNSSLKRWIVSETTQQKNISSNFGFIEETMELSCILLAVTLKPCCFCVKGGGGHGRNTIDACFRLTPIKGRRNWGWRGFNCTPRFCQVQNKNLFLQKTLFNYVPLQIFTPSAGSDWIGLLPAPLHLATFIIITGL